MCLEGCFLLLRNKSFLIWIKCSQVFALKKITNNLVCTIISCRNINICLVKDFWVVLCFTLFIYSTEDR